MKTKMVVALVVLAFLLSPVAAFAEGSPWTSASTFGDKVKGKLEFGIKNLLTGWTELLTQPSKAFKEDKSKVFTGLATGAYNAVAYTAGGILHTATFFLPAIDVPLPNNGVSLE